jgi:CheY-like chemotaxis protein
VIPEQILMMPPFPCEILQAPREIVRVRVLIVDDEPLVRWALASALRARGFDTATASCAAEALAEACTGRPPAIVLIDLELYGTDSRALAEQIRATAPGCRIVALSTSGLEAPAAAPWSGVTLIRKPFDLPDVIRLVERELAVAAAPAPTRPRAGDASGGPTE